MCSIKTKISYLNLRKCFKNMLYKKNRADVVQPPALKRLVNDDSQIRLACKDRRNGGEVTLGGVGNDLRQRGLACAWRSLQNNELKKFVGFDGAAQKFAFTYNMFLSDVFIQCSQAHPRGKRRFAFQAFVHGVVKEVVGH